MLKKPFTSVNFDFDGVIGNTIQCITSLYNEDFKYYENFEPINGEDINTYDFNECKCATHEQILNYFNQPRFFERLTLMPWADRVINELTEIYPVKIISIGTYANLTQKKILIADKFPKVEFIGINVHKFNDKSHIDMNGAIFFDDLSKYLFTSNAAEKVCFGKIYPWNSNWNGKRMNDFMEIREYLIQGGEE